MMKNEKILTQRKKRRKTQRRKRSKQEKTVKVITHQIPKQNRIKILQRKIRTEIIVAILQRLQIQTAVIGNARLTIVIADVDRPPDVESLHRADAEAALPADGIIRPHEEVLHVKTANLYVVDECLPKMTREDDDANILDHR